MKGKVLFFKDTYGFIQSKEVDQDIYFHFSDIMSGGNFKELLAGDTVEFDISRGINNYQLKAINVFKIENKIEGKRVIRARVLSLDSLNLSSTGGLRTLAYSCESDGLRCVNVLQSVIVFTDKEITTAEALAVINVSVTPDVNTINCNGSKVIYVSNELDYTIQFV